MRFVSLISLVCLSAASLAACSASGHADPASGAPPPARVEREGDDMAIEVKHPEQFPLATAAAREAAPRLSVTGVVQPDVSRAVPVLSLASGRVLEVRARLGDHVRKGDMLLRIQSADIASAFADYRKAIADQTLAQSQLDRASALFERGAIAKKDREVAEDAAVKARVDVENATERLSILGADATRPPSAAIDILAPATGVITEQNVTNAGGVKSIDNSPNLFTIADLSRVWIVCDVFENDLAMVRVGDAADIHLASYPGTVLTGHIGNIGAVLDPALRTAKVRVEVANPGLMRVGMFVTAILHGQSKQTRAVVPAAAILHLHDREWVYVPTGTGQFRRLEVKGGDTLPGNLQEVVSGLRPGQQVVASALTFQNTVGQ